MKYLAPLFVVSLVACGDKSEDDSNATGDTAATMAARLLQDTRFAPTPSPTEPRPGGISVGAPVLTISTDSGGDGTIDRVQQMTYDDRGNRVLLEEDNGGDGVFDVVTAFSYAYDARDRLVEIGTDEGADGTIESVEVRTLDDRGRALKILHTDANGEPTKVEVNTWDAKGRRQSWTIDSPVGGPIETTQTWRFDDQGRPDGRTTTQVMPDGKPRTSIFRDIVDADGRLVGHENDLDGDGDADNTNRRLYDGSGRLAEIRIDTDLDGNDDSTTIYSYDGQGRLVQLSIDTGLDGTSDTVIYRDYSNFKPEHDCLTR